MTQKHYDRKMILVDGKQTFLLSSWGGESVLDGNIHLLVSGPETLLMKEHTVTELDGSPLLFMEMPEVADIIPPRTNLKDPKVITYCDFGDRCRKTELCRHKTIATAMRQYARIWEIYGRANKWRVWQEEP